MKKALKFVLKIPGFLLLSILIGYNVFLLNAKFVLHEQLPMLNGYGHAIVLSGSMQPTFDVNDLLIIQKCDKYEVDDIVTFVDKNNDLVTHRIISIDSKNETFITRGDANNIHDPELKTDRIKGKVICIIPKFGNVISFLQNPFCVLTVVTIAFILLERSYSKEKEKKQSDIDKIKAEIELLKKSDATADTPDSEQVGNISPTAENDTENHTL